MNRGLVRECHVMRSLRTSVIPLHRTDPQTRRTNSKCLHKNVRNDRDRCSIPHPLSPIQQDLLFIQADRIKHPDSNRDAGIQTQ